LTSFLQILAFNQPTGPAGTTSTQSGSVSQAPLVVTSQTSKSKDTEKESEDEAEVKAEEGGQSKSKSSKEKDRASSFIESQQVAAKSTSEKNNSSVLAFEEDASISVSDSED
jgi:hypothetical protein